MDLILLNFFLITVFSKSLFSFGILGFNFAPWDLFILYPIVRHKLFFPHHIRRIYVAVSILVCGIFLSTLMNFSESYAFVGVILQILRNLFLLDLFYRVGAKFDQRHFRCTFTTWGVVIPIVHLIAYYSPLQTAITEPSVGNFMRLEGFVGDANFFAFSVLLLALSVRKYQIFVVFLILPCILLTGSRSGLALWCILSYICFRNYRGHLLVSIIFVLVIFGKTILAYVQKYEALISVFNRSIADFSRFRLWTEALTKMDDKYFFGNGPKAFVYDIGNFSHNDFITAYYEYGLLGFITFTIVIITILRLPFPKRLNVNLDLQVAYLSVFLILNLFSFWLFPHIWILYGALLGYCALVSKSIGRMAPMTTVH